MLQLLVDGYVLASNAYTAKELNTVLEFRCVFVKKKSAADADLTLQHFRQLLLQKATDKCVDYQKKIILYKHHGKSTKMVRLRDISSLTLHSHLFLVLF